MRTIEENIDMRIQYYNKLCELKGYKYGYLAVEYVYGGCSLYYCSKADIEKHCVGGLLVNGTRKQVYETICALDTMLNYQA